MERACRAARPFCFSRTAVAAVPTAVRAAATAVRPPPTAVRVVRPAVALAPTQVAAVATVVWAVRTAVRVVRTAVAPSRTEVAIVATAVQGTRTAVRVLRTTVAAAATAGWRAATVVATTRTAVGATSSLPACPGNRRLPGMHEQTRRVLEVLRISVRLQGITHREIEQRLGWSRNYLGRLFSGEIQLKFDHLPPLLEILGIEPDEFFRIAFPPLPPPSRHLHEAELRSMLEKIRERFGAGAGLDPDG